MIEKERMHTQLFGNIFLIERKLEQLGNKKLESRGVTIKQWMVLAAIGNLDGMPSVSEIAAYLDMTHQNIKQLCIQLERKGHINLEKDSKDKRIIRVAVTQKSKDTWDQSGKEDMAFISSIFSCFGMSEIESLDKMIERLRIHLEALTAIGDMQPND